MSFLHAAKKTVSNGFNKMNTSEGSIRGGGGVASTTADHHANSHNSGTHYTAGPANGNKQKMWGGFYPKNHQ